MVIKESFSLTATNNDVLSAPSRLSALPSDGLLTLEIAATDADATNYGTVTLQLPDGDIPFEDLLVPYNGYSTADQTVHDDTELMVQMEVQQGGHVLLSYTENGTVAFCTIYATYEF